MPLYVIGRMNTHQVVVESRWDVRWSRLGCGRALVLRGDTSACGIAASQLRTPRGIAMLCVRRLIVLRIFSLSLVIFSEFRERMYNSENNSEIQSGRYPSDRNLLELEDEDLEKSLRLTVSVNGGMTPTLTGLLLIGSEESLRRLVPTNEAVFQVLVGTDIRVNQTIVDRCSNHRTNSEAFKTMESGDGTECRTVFFDGA